MRYYRLPNGKYISEAEYKLFLLQCIVILRRFIEIEKKKLSEDGGAEHDL